jgi:hypothetical protein
MAALVVGVGVICLLCALCTEHRPLCARTNLPCGVLPRPSVFNIQFLDRKRVLPIDSDRVDVVKGFNSVEVRSVLSKQKIETRHAAAHNDCFTVGVLVDIDAAVVTHHPRVPQGCERTVVHGRGDDSDGSRVRWLRGLDAHVVRGS